MCVREGVTPGTVPVRDDEKIMLDEIERYLRETRIAVMDMKNGFACRSEVMDKLGYLAGLVSRMVGTLDPRQEAARRRYVTAARELKAVEGELEVDENAKISMGDPEQGAYVQAWAWLSAADVYGNCPDCGHAKLPDHSCPATER
jgi:hypothetical protein